MTKDGLIYVKPAPGRTVRDYRTMLPVPTDGMYVSPGDPHWMASLNFQDLVEAEPPREEREPVAAEPEVVGPHAASGPEQEPTHHDVLPAA